MLICITSYQNLSPYHKYSHSREDKGGKVKERNFRRFDSKEGIELLGNLGKKILTCMKLLLL